MDLNFARLLFLMYLEMYILHSHGAFSSASKQCNGCTWHLLTADRCILTVVVLLSR